MLFELYVTFCLFTADPTEPIQCENQFRAYLSDRTTPHRCVEFGLAELQAIESEDHGKWDVVRFFCREIHQKGQDVS